MIDAIEQPEVQSTDLANLPPADRAALALNSSKTEADLKQLATSLTAITLVNSPAGRDQAHALAMTARSARTAIEKAGKAARDDATKFSKAVIAEEDRLIGIIQPEETRVLGLRNAWDAAEAARKEAEARVERERIERHQAVIDRIKSMPGLAREARTADMALQLLGKLHAIDTARLEEFADAAQAALLLADEQISGIIESKAAAEAEAARIKAEQEAEAARLAQEREELARQQAEAKRQADELAAQQKAVADQLAAQRAELDRQRAELAAQQAAIDAAKEPPPEPLPEPAPVEVAAPQVQPLAAEVERAVITTGTAMVSGGKVFDANDINRTPNTAPPAVKLVEEIAFAFGVEISTASRWLAHRADEFKALAESNQ